MPRDTRSTTKLQQFINLTDLPADCVAAPTAYIAPRPNTKPVGRFNGSAYYHRHDVLPLRTREDWQRVGRKVKSGEKPLAVRGVEPAEVEVFAEWQTA
jgi:hypothetical protein